MRLFGQVDRVPGCFHVATAFVHLFGLPLMPRGSYLVAERDAARFSIPPAPRSRRWAYLRAMLGLAAVAGAVVGVAAASSARPLVAVGSFFLAAACWASLRWSLRQTWAGERRAWELARQLEHFRAAGQP